MKAWLVESQRPAESAPLVAREKVLAEPGPGQVRLRVLACGVCRTDVHVAEGDLPLRAGAIVPGHQIVGEVEALGTGVSVWHPGDRVGVTWLAEACGACADCASGRENLCARARFTGWDVDGGFAERTIARADFCVPLPRDLPPLEAAPLLCAGVIGYRALRLSGLEPGGRLGLVGFGASAHLALQIARARGCEVLVFTRGAGHRARAAALGATWTGALADGPGGRAAACDAIVSFTPSGDTVPQALRHLRPGGTLAINAVHLTDIPSFPYELLFGERTVRSVSNLTREDARGLLELAAAGTVRARPQPYPFARANEALLAVKRSSLDGQAVLEVGA